MKSKYFENGLAVIGLVLVFVGVTAAANIALAGDIGTVEIYVAALK
jgi:hypothetical protein